MRNVCGNVSKQKLELRKAFTKAESVDKMLKLFKQIEKLNDESELGFYCWKLAHQSLTELDQVLSFGNRALRIFIDNDTNNIPCFGATFSEISTPTGRGGSLCTYYHKSSLYIAHLCNLLCCACRKLKRYDEGMSYLNWANRNVSKLLEMESSCGRYCLLETLRANQMGIFRLKCDTGRFDDAVIPLRKSLEIEESMAEEGCIGLGYINAMLCLNYVIIMTYKEALPFCLKALEIFTKHLGGNSVEVAQMTRQLACIYNEFGDHEKALERNQLSQSIFKDKIPDSPEFFVGENVTGKILIELGRYVESIDVLNRVVSHTNIVEIVRGIAFVNLAKAFIYLGKCAKAKKKLKTAQRILEKIEDEPITVADGFRHMSMLYEKMNDFENAISLLRRVLSVPEIPQILLVEGSARLFSLISLSGKEEEGIAYMVDVVEKLKDKFGPVHHEVGYGYRNLGAAYCKSGQEELAVKFMVQAKEIMDVTLGPCHLDSLKTSQSLAETYATLRRFGPAIEIQEKVVELLEVLEPREQEFVDTAIKLLNKMKERVPVYGSMILKP